MPNLKRLREVVLKIFEYFSPIAMNIGLSEAGPFCILNKFGRRLKDNATYQISNI